MKTGAKKAGHFGPNRKTRALQPIINRVNELESVVEALSDEELAGKTAEFKNRYHRGESLDHLLPEAFAVVRETAKRTLGERHFDEQIMGGVVLHQGKIAEMATGEGKTLTATLPVYLNHFAGRGVHVVTVNDYLAARDSEWMGSIYRFLGMSVGCIQAQMEPASRKEQYAADVTYGTNNEFGFDYLRDNLTYSLENIVQRDFYYAIVDEVDNILIDEARTPLIISGEDPRAEGRYKYDLLFAKMVRRLKPGIDYEVNEKDHAVVLTEEGLQKVESSLGRDLHPDEETLKGLSQEQRDELDNLRHHLETALKAKELYHREVDYIIKDGEVIIVDEFTGRMMIGRRYSDGIHEAIEAKEGVSIARPSQTLATITFQYYFRMYDKLAGMTGTASESSDEFYRTYGLEVVTIPTHEPMIREDFPDVIYKTEQAKYEAVVREICECYERGQPVLVGTVAVEKSEKLSKMLDRQGIPHEVLNAKHHRREAEIIAQAGEKYAVTIATNMAGRGVDIKLGEGVAELGGLKVIGTERHDARRIDNQLKGRSGRQGDPGSSRFYLSCEDDLMRLFAADRIARIMDRFNFPEDLPIENRMVTRAIESAQENVELTNFERRKNLLKYDDVMNTQRERIYSYRRSLLEGGDFAEEACQWVEEAIRSTVERYADPKVFPEDWDLDGLFTAMRDMMPLSMGPEDFELRGLTPEDLLEAFLDEARRMYASREEELGSDVIRELERRIMFDVIDENWMMHLRDLDYLQEGIGWRAMAQRDPLVEYTRESFEMFDEMMKRIKEEFARKVFFAKLVPVASERELLRVVASAGGGEEEKRPVQRRSEKVGRNEPCPCGSGLKYKRCCGSD